MARFGILAAMRSALLLLALLTGITAFASLIRVVGSPALLESYRTSFSFTPGARFGNRLLQVQDAARPTCLILGNSAAREAFDTLYLDQALPARRFVNAGTTGGNNLVFEMQAAALVSSKARPDCTLLAMNSWNLYAGERPPVAGEDYLALLGWRDVARLSYHPLASSEVRRVGLGLALPLKAQARQLNRLIRHRIFRWRAHSRWPLPIARYSSFAGELNADGLYLYADKPSILRRDWSRFDARSRRYADPALYGGAEQAASLRRTLRLLAKASKRTDIVLLPQSPLLERASRLAMPAFLDAVRPFRGTVRIVDCTKLNNLDYFIDEGHLNAAGRRELSAAMAAYLRSPASQTVGHCRALDDNFAGKRG